jgi:riboflavin biosynthesis pyrimidine reductase
VLRDGGKTIIATYLKTSDVKIEYLRKTNVDFIKVEDGPGGLDLKKILARLGEMKITSVLVEGGGKVFTSFLRQDLCHRLSVFTAPLLIGAGTEAVGDLGVLKLSQALRLQDVSVRTLGNQSVFEGNLAWMHGRAAGGACDQSFGLEEDKDVYRLG